MRGGMGLLGVLGKYGMYRLNNSLALQNDRPSWSPAQGLCSQCTDLYLARAAELDTGLTRESEPDTAGWGRRA